MITLLLFLISPAYAMPGGGRTVGEFSASDRPPTAGPIHHPDYSVTNAGLADVRNVLSGGTTEALKQANDRQSGIIQNQLSQAQTHLQTQATALAASHQARVNTPHSYTPVAIPMEEHKKSKPIDISKVLRLKEDRLPYRFQSGDGEFREQIVNQYADLYRLDVRGKRLLAKGFGLSATETADKAYSDGELEDAYFYKDVGKIFLDIAVGIDPVTGFGRSSFELLTGKNLITGATLSNFERGLAFVGVASLGFSGSVRTTERMFHIFDGAKRLLSERKAFQAALKEGDILFDKADRLFSKMMHQHRLTNIHTAEHVNKTHFPDWVKTPPFQSKTHVVEFLTSKETQWVRVHGPKNQAGAWIMRRSAIEGLSPLEIQKKFALPHTPTFVSEVHLPKGTTVFRGNIEDHGLGGAGNVQYWLRDRLSLDAFKNMKEL